MQVDINRAVNGKPNGILILAVLSGNYGKQWLPQALITRHRPPSAPCLRHPGHTLGGAKTDLLFPLETKHRPSSVIQVCPSIRPFLDPDHGQDDEVSKARCLH